MRNSFNQRNDINTDDNNTDLDDLYGLNWQKIPLLWRQGVSTDNKLRFWTWYIYIYLTKTQKLGRIDRG